MATPGPNVSVSQSSALETLRLHAQSERRRQSLRAILTVVIGIPVAVAVVFGLLMLLDNL